MLLTCRDAFYGGAAGGGKTVALLADSLQYVDYPYYNALLMRDTYKNLSMPESLMDLSFQWLKNTDAVWKGEDKKWVFPSGATICFGYLDGPLDHFNYQSAAFQYVGIDEVVNIRENQALYMFSRMRKPKSSPVPIRFRCASNPPAQEQISKGAWVKRRYIDKETRIPGSVFISAKMDDNEYLDKEDYNRSLDNLDPVTRAQLRDGDWEVKNSGNLFKREWFKIVSQMEGRPTGIVRYWDLAATEQKDNNNPAYTASCLMAKNEHGQFYVLDVDRFRGTPGVVERRVRQTADLDGTNVPIVMEREPGSSGVNTIHHYRTRILPEFIFNEDLPSGDKTERARPLSSQSEAGNIIFVKGRWINDWFEEAELFPDSEFKDQVDVTAGAFNWIARRGAFRIRTI